MTRKKSKIKAYKRKWHRLSTEDRIFVIKFLAGAFACLVIILSLLGLLIFHFTHNAHPHTKNRTENDSIKKEVSSEEKTSEKKSAGSQKKDSEKENDSSKEKDRTSEEPEITSDHPDVQLLAKLVFAEAGGASKQTQIAVASVVLNRVKSDKYPNTISEVIYQRGQYTPARNGSLNQTPTEEALENALYVYKNGSQIPSNVLYQSKYKQGSGVWAELDDNYFCYE